MSSPFFPTDRIIYLKWNLMISLLCLNPSVAPDNLLDWGLTVWEGALPVWSLPIFPLSALFLITLHLTLYTPAIPSLLSISACPRFCSSVWNAYSSPERHQPPALGPGWLWLSFQIHSRRPSRTSPHWAPVSLGSSAVAYLYSPSLKWPLALPTLPPRWGKSAVFYACCFTESILIMTSPSLQSVMTSIELTTETRSPLAFRPSVV